MSGLNKTSADMFSISTIPQGIINNDQGFFKNEVVLDITRVPIVDLAYLSNVSDIKSLEVTDSFILYIK